MGGRLALFKAVAKPRIHVLVRELEITLDDNDSAVLAAVPLSWPKVHLEMLAQLFFEGLNSPALYILPQPLATLYGYGVGNGLVVDIGYTSTSKLLLWHMTDQLELTPIVDCCIVSYGHNTIAFGTKDFDNFLLEHIASNSELQAAFSEVKLDLDLVQYLREAGHLNFAKKDAPPAEAPSHASPKSDTVPPSSKLMLEYNGSTIEVNETLLEINEQMFPSKIASLE
ncbi:hypothetical protein L0F63_006027 [Massospora cicadina]|nr:hypothetical protein L0F63_006027 [Massospora cicadina]